MQCYFIFDYSVSVSGHLQTWKNFAQNKYTEQTYIKPFKQGPQVQPVVGPRKPQLRPGSSDRSVIVPSIFHTVNSLLQANITS